jgi:serine acetyltransferase
MFRAARVLRTSPNSVARALGRVFCLGYLVVVEWTWGIELPWATEVGPRLRIFHGTGIVVNAAAKLGCDVILRQGVCIGSRIADGGCPTIGDGASLGANSIVLGTVFVGAGSHVGAGAVVLTDIPAGRSAVGNPARTIS